MKWFIMIFVCSGCSMMVEPKDKEDAGNNDSVTVTNVASDSSNDSGDAKATESDNQTESESGDTQIGSDLGTSTETETGTEEAGTESVPNCKAGEVKCANSTTVLSCVSNQWVVTDNCSGADTCIDGKCGCNDTDPTGIRVCENNKLYDKMFCGQDMLVYDCTPYGNTCMKQGGINTCVYIQFLDPYKTCTDKRTACVTNRDSSISVVNYLRRSDNSWADLVPVKNCSYGCNQIDLCTAQCY